MSQIVTVFQGLAEASQPLSGVVNTWHAAIIVSSIVAFAIALIEKLSRVHNTFRVEYFLYRFHGGYLCSTA